MVGALSSRDLKVSLDAKTSSCAALAAAAMGDLSVASIAGGLDAWVTAGKTVVKLGQPFFD